MMGIIARRMNAAANCAQLLEVAGEAPIVADPGERSRDNPDLGSTRKRCNPSPDTELTPQRLEIGTQFTMRL